MIAKERKFFREICSGDYEVRIYTIHEKGYKNVWLYEFDIKNNSKELIYSSSNEEMLLNELQDWCIKQRESIEEIEKWINSERKKVDKNKF